MSSRDLAHRLGPHIPKHIMDAFQMVDRRSFLPYIYYYRDGTWDWVITGDQAYEDSAQITFLDSDGQPSCITPRPFSLAQMIALLRVGSSDQVLLLHAESGYTAGLLRVLTTETVVVVEPERTIRENAQICLDRSHFLDRVKVVPGSYTDGCAVHAPYQRILLLRSFETFSASWLHQLDDEGMLVGYWTKILIPVLVRVMAFKDCKWIGVLSRYEETLLPLEQKSVPLLKLFEQMPLIQEEFLLSAPSLLKRRAFLFYLGLNLPGLSLYKNEHLFLFFTQDACLRFVQEDKTWKAYAHGDRNLYPLFLRHMQDWENRGSPELTSYCLDIFPDGTVDVHLSQETYWSIK